MAMAPAEATVRSIVARAMPPHERLALGSDDAAGGPETARRVAAWKASVARDPGAVPGLMASLGLDDATLARMLSPVEISDDAPLPRWAGIIERALAPESSLPIEPGDGVLAPFMAVARDDLRETAGGLRIAVSDAAQRDLLDTLRVRLWRAVSPTLEHEKQLLNATGLLFAPAGEASRIDGSAQGWRIRLDTYPVLAYVVGTAIEHWRSFTAELLMRLDADAALLSRELFEGAPRHAVTAISGDAGDLHNGGRSVAILTFQDGQKVVYKPKDLSVAVAYMALVERLNGLGLPLALPTRTVLPRGPYSWEAYVTAEGCADIAAVERFYTRMGETIRLFQLLEARDFWLDNLIAQGEYPQFVDLEMLVQPRIATPSTLSPAEREAWEALEETAHRTAAIGMPMPIAQGAPAEELGALAGPGPFASPFRFDTAALAEGRELPPLTSEGHVLWEHPEHVPRVDQDFADATDHLDEVIAGYRAMQECLVANRDAVMDAVEAFRDTPVRYIYRDTWTCLKLIQHSVSPGLLTDAAHREIFLSRLYAPVIESGGEGEGMTLVVRSEIGSLRGLDVPFFQGIPASRDLLAGDGQVIADYFPEPAFERLKRRVSALDRFPLDTQIDALRSSFACGRPFAPVHIAPGRDGDGVPATDDLLRIAIDLADGILDDSFGDGRAWLGLTYHPPVDCGGFDVLRPDLLTGTTGLAVLFADLYRSTGEARWRDAARRSLEPTLAAWEAWDRQPGGAASGAFYGSGSWLYGAARVADALDDDALRATIDRRGASMTRQLDIERLPLAGDVVDGPIGLMLAALATVPDQLDAATLADRLLTRLGEGSVTGQSHRTPGHALSSLPRGEAGIALAASRLLALLPETGSARNGLATWANDTLARIPVSTQEPGTIAVAAGLGMAGVPVDAWRDAIRQWLDAHAGSSDPYRLLDVIEIALLMNDDPGARRQGEVALRRLLGVRQSAGTWFPGTQAADRHNLSLIWGVPAVAHALVRWSAAARVSSVRLVARECHPPYARVR